MRGRVAVAAALLLSAGGRAQAADYWALSDGNLEIVAQGSEKNVLELAGNLRRLDQALASVLSVDLGGERTPVYVYSLPHTQIRRVLPQQGDFDSFYTASELGTNILINSNAHTDRRYWGAYFGYAGSLLMVNAGVAAYPAWLRQGISEVFAASSMAGDQVTLGGYESGRVQQLYLASSAGSLIRAETLLTVTADDARMGDADFRSRWQSESWLLAHLVLIEGQMRAQFKAYLAALADGRDAATAVAAGFPGGFHDIDTLFADALRAGRLSMVNVRTTAPRIGTEPQRLTEAQLSGRLGELAARGGQLDLALGLTDEALRADPADQWALRGRLTGQMRKKQYADAQQTLQSLQSLPQASERSRADVAAMLARLSLVPAAQLPAGMDAAALRVQALAALETAVSRDPDEQPLWALLTQLHLRDADRQQSLAFGRRGEQALYAHPGWTLLASGLAGLYGRWGESADAFRFAVFWRDHATMPREHAAAERLVQDLRTRLPSAAGAGATAQ